MSRLRKILSFIILVLSDIAALFASFLIAYFIRGNVLPGLFSGFELEPLSLAIHIKYAFSYGVLIIVIVFAFEKLYTKRLTFWEEARPLLKGATLTFILIMVIVFVSRRYIQYSRAIIILAWLLSLILFPLFRLIIKNVLMSINLWKKKIVIVGTEGIAKLVAQEIKKNKTLGYDVIGFLAEEKKKVGNRVGSLKIIGEISQFEDLSKKLDIKDVIIALPISSQDSLINIMEHCEKTAETIRIIPSVGSLFTMGVEIENFGDVLSLSVARNLVKPWNIFIKTIFEFIIVVIGSVFLLPVFLIIALAIKLDSPGSVLYIQGRLGEKYRTFRFFKFRSMYVDGDLRLEEYLKKHPELRKEWNRYQKLKGKDPRVTRVGKVIRRYSLDEIPQLINFFKRDMNLVGPRAYMPRELKKIGKSYQIISRVKPSITGLWQVRGRSLLPFKERLILDEYYIRNWSLWLDIVILLKTIKVLITREGAF
ncbi:MAG: undecaprenyl-phosphate galactose phosphotransferase WbaP [Candidatus Aminicenantaceae bacterium]